jgi:catechol 2,3-dioxygenase-like lactoylglutathione lyase family enzyme/predicted enzyme related to lactoylglutathione lyase
MTNLPQPVLGEITALTITSPNLEESLRFYQKLGFSEVMRMNFPFPWIQISDGALLIMLRENDQPYIALTYYVKDIDKRRLLIEEAGLVFTETPRPTDALKKYVLQSPDGINVSLVQLSDGFSQPPGPTMLTMPQQDYFDPSKYTNKTCGMYGEFAQPVEDLERSISFWEKLGFQTLSKNSSPHPWAILSDGLAVIGLHQTQQFSEPAITFFAADMKDKIVKLKEQGIEVLKELSPANVVLLTPEQQKINLYSLGM